MSILPVESGYWAYSRSFVRSANPSISTRKHCKTGHWRRMWGCRAVYSFGIWGRCCPGNAHKNSFCGELNHNELLSYSLIVWSGVVWHRQGGREDGSGGCGSYHLFRFQQSRRQLVEIAEAFDYAHELGNTINSGVICATITSKKDGVDHHAAADLNRGSRPSWVTIKGYCEAEAAYYNLVWWSPQSNSFEKTDERMYTESTTDHPIDSFAVIR